MSENFSFRLSLTPLLLLYIKKNSVLTNHNARIFIEWMKQGQTLEDGRRWGTKKKVSFGARDDLGQIGSSASFPQAETLVKIEIGNGGKKLNPRKYNIFFLIFPFLLSLFRGVYFSHIIGTIFMFYFILSHYWLVLQ